jgi:hypothetical protein
VRGICANRYADGADTCAVVLLRIKIESVSPEKNACVERCVEILISSCFSPYEHQSLTNQSQIKTFSEEYIKAGALDNFEYIKNFNALKT